MTEESMAWLGCALWIADLWDAPREVAAQGADALMAALRSVPDGGESQ